MAIEIKINCRKYFLLSILPEDKKVEKSTKKSEIEESLCYHRYWAGVSFSTISTHMIRVFWLQMHLNKIRRSCNKKRKGSRETELFHTSSLSRSWCVIKSLKFPSKQRASRFLEFAGLWAFKSVHPAFHHFHVNFNTK